MHLATKARVDTESRAVRGTIADCRYVEQVWASGISCVRTSALVDRTCHSRKLESVVGSLALRNVVLHDQHVLNHTLVTQVDVHVVIVTENGDEVAAVHSTTEPFESVVRIGYHLDVFDASATSYTTHGEAINFVTIAELITAETQRHETENTGVIIWLRYTSAGTVKNTSVVGVGGETFDQSLTDDLTISAFTGRQRGTTQKNQTTPETAIATGNGLLTCKWMVGRKTIALSYRSNNNRLGCSTFGKQFAATCHHDRTVGVVIFVNGIFVIRISVDGSAGLDDEGCTIFYKDDVWQIPIIAIRAWLDHVSARW